VARPNWEFIRVDVQLPDHPKLDELTAAAKWTLLELWCWCAKNTTDGFVRDARWKTFGTPPIRASLVKARLAERAPGGYQMHDYLDHQRSLAEITEISEKRAAAGRRSAQARAEARAHAEQDAQQVAQQVAEQDAEQTRSKPATEAEAEAVSTSPTSGDVGGDVRGDVGRLCDHLADRIDANGAKRPAITGKWRDAARLMIDRDKRTEDQVHLAIDWSQDHEFWRSNILSMPKLREKYDQLRLQASRPNGKPAGKTGMLSRAMERAEKRETDDANRNGEADGIRQRMLPAAGDG
jgi:hypothetical protein